MPCTPEQVAPFVQLALEAIHREYPVALILTLERDGDLGLPRELTPSFFGSFDWHSAVHSHWCLARAVRRFPDASFASPARAALARTLTPERLSREHEFVARRPGFERPYGLAWLLQLAAELRTWDDPGARSWSGSLRPLETLAASRLVTWAERLPWPVRSGEHAQSAFAFGLLLDWARDAGEPAVAARVAARVRLLHEHDRDAPVAFEPSAHDFLSPILGVADVMRRTLGQDAFGDWFGNYLPALARESSRVWLEPVEPPDRTDGKLAHLDGLNLSRAWMLEGILAALPGGHAAHDVLAAAAQRHRTCGLAGARGTHYMGTHWLGSFAVYLLTERGLS